MSSAFELNKIVSQGFPALWASILIGGLLAITGWAGACYFARLWNRSFRLQIWHHLLCGVAAVITLVSVPVWVAASSLEDAVESTSTTLDKLATSEDWQREAFEQAYKAVGAGRSEQKDFSDMSSSRKQERQILLADSTSERAVVHAYVKHAVCTVTREYPQLEPLLRRASAAAIRTLSNQIQPSSEEDIFVYPGGGIAQQLTSKIGTTLFAPIKLWVWRIRLVVAGLFFLTQTLAFGVAGVSAVQGLDV
jgi:hypothetical protein